MTPESVDQDAAMLRHRLAQQIADEGKVRSPQWLEAIANVPRHEFVQEFFTRVEDGAGPTLWEPTDPQRSGVRRWLELAYTDSSHVTQLDGHLAPFDVTSGVNGTPTSSSTLPSLVVQMWEDLDARDGDRVLEVGTGTGYSTALGCYRLGDKNITSIEVDPSIAAKARQSLERVDYHPHLIAGDGLNGVPDGAPYDRIIATCALRSVPPAWIEQSRRGTVILVTLSGWLGGTGLAKLTVTGTGTAEGRFLPGYVSFMPARAHASQPATIPVLDDKAPLRSTAFGPDVISSYGAAQMIAQLAAPDAQYLQLIADDGAAEHLVVQDDSSYAHFAGEPGNWAVQQGGPVQLWDKVEEALAKWHASGQPNLDTFRIRVTPDRQVIDVAGWTGELPTRTIGGSSTG
ncbi:ATP-grasp peptide maturase system methyltransferase [Kribbella albertanoniae]|uniref:ATP-grasp peptide maturase system methyltransferase n=1 Tax=Kribbella albertanoniae TaxID=1266829 RepID=UPI001EE0B699|nr:ATP-grasp peptide maturase system methyltransferase [Kribbella albertanoniae]